MEPKIVAGSVVQFRSGGPLMTVEAVDGNFAHCIWLDPAQKPVTTMVALAALVLRDEAVVELYGAAAAVVDGARNDGVEFGGCFDYSLSDENHALVERFVAALNAIDGKARRWSRESPCC